MKLPARWLSKWLSAWVAIVVMSPAIAQYQWRDDSGRMVYSDQPPPSTIKPSQILRAEPMAPMRPSAAAPAPDVKSLADRQMEEKKRSQEREETARKQRDDQERASRTQQVCDAMRVELRTLDSGMRIATIGANGEREFVTDEAREKRQSQLRKDMSGMCQSAG